MTVVTLMENMYYLGPFLFALPSSSLKSTFEGLFASTKSTNATELPNRANTWCPFMEVGINDVSSPNGITQSVEFALHARIKSSIVLNDKNTTFPA
jgi:hypothetical protein